ncbi:MAG: arylesterase, partial [Pseudomonadales bacterium]|nr:arylesterase [Pseudomonadales bacterium]
MSNTAIGEPSTSGEQQQAPASIPTLLVLGDSLSASYGFDPALGWVTLLEAWLLDQSIPVSVVNVSISGETTSGGLQRLPAALARWQPELVVIALGGNDGLRGTSLKVIGNNLESMIKLSQEHGAKTLLAGMRIPPNYGPRYTQG